MFKVIIAVEWCNDKPVYIKRWDKELLIGFEAEIEIELPFAPYPDLTIEIPERCEEPDHYRFKLDSLVWDHEKKQFFAMCREVIGCESFDEMERVAKLYERDGFTVSRDNMCPGEW